MLLDPRPDLLTGVSDQPGGVGGRVSVQQPGTHLREQVGGHGLLPVEWAPLVAFQQYLACRLDPSGQGVGRHPQQRPQGRRTGPVPVPELPQLDQTVPDLAPNPGCERLGLFA